MGRRPQAAQGASRSTAAAPTQEQPRHRKVQVQVCEVVPLLLGLRCGQGRRQTDGAEGGSHHPVPAPYPSKGLARVLGGGELLPQVSTQHRGGVPRCHSPTPLRPGDCKGDGEGVQDPVGREGTDRQLQQVEAAAGPGMHPDSSGSHSTPGPGHRRVEGGLRRNAPAAIAQGGLGTLGLLVAALEAKSMCLDNIQAGDVRGTAGHSPLPRRDCGATTDSLLRPSAPGPGLQIAQPSHARPDRLQSLDGDRPMVS